MVAKKVRSWRLRRWASYLVRHATSADPASEHYYNKVIAFYHERYSSVALQLAELTGPTRADKLLLRESFRTRLPYRAGYLCWWGVGSRFGLLGFSATLIPMVMGLLVVVAVGHTRGRRAAERVLCGKSRPEPREVYSDDPTAVLLALSRRGRRVALKRVQEFPAKSLTGKHRDLLLAELPALGPEEVETLEKLAAEFDGSIGELFVTVRLLA